MNALKKFLNVVLILIGVVLIIFCVDLVANKTLNKSYSDLSELDQSALAEIGEIVNLFDEDDGNDEIWDSKYNPTDAGFVITRTFGSLKGTSYAVNVDLSGNIFAQKIEMPEKYSDITVYRLSYLAPQTISLFVNGDEDAYVRLNDKEICAVKYDNAEIMYNGSGSLEEAYVKSTFAQQVETEDCPTVEPKESFELTEENIALTGLQYRILDDLRDAEDLETVNELVAEYVLVREYQLEKNPALAKQQETIELVDGRAQFVFYNISEEVDHNITYFNKEKSEEIDFYSAYYYVCTGHYQSPTEEYFDYMGNVYVGAALCEIIRDKGLVARWEEKLDNSTNADFVSQYSLLKEYCGMACSQYNEKTLDEVKEAYNYEEILNMAATLVDGNAKE